MPPSGLVVEDPSEGISAPALAKQTGAWLAPNARYTVTKDAAGVAAVKLLNGDDKVVFVDLNRKHAYTAATKSVLTNPTYSGATPSIALDFSKADNELAGKTYHPRAFVSVDKDVTGDLLLRKEVQGRAAVTAPTQKWGVTHSSQDVDAKSIGTIAVDNLEPCPADQIYHDQSITVAEAAVAVDLARNTMQVTKETLPSFIAPAITAKPKNQFERV